MQLGNSPGEAVNLGWNHRPAPVVLTAEEERQRQALRESVGAAALVQTTHVQLGNGQLEGGKGLGKRGFTLRKIGSIKRSPTTKQSVSLERPRSHERALHPSHRRASNTSDKPVQIPSDRRPHDEPTRGFGGRGGKVDLAGLSHTNRGYSAGLGLKNRNVSQGSSSGRSMPFGMTRADDSAGGEAANAERTASWRPNFRPQCSRQADQEERHQFLERRKVQQGTEDQVMWKPSAVEGNAIAVPATDGGEVKKDDAALERQRRRELKFALENDPASATTMGATRARERARGRRRIDAIADYDNEANEEELRAVKRRERKREKLAKKRIAKYIQAPAIPILLPEFISIANLARVLKVRIEDFIQKMEELGFQETRYDHVLNSETAGLIAMEYNYEPIADHSHTEDLRARPLAEDKSLLAARPPVVTIMGHVDHGKTTILDWLRKSSVVASEYGGITQHIGAFSVSMPSGKLITFLDTPGHAAFLSMRQRGANVTDVVVLVVAADDSVKPQTIEAIRHAKSANVPMIVAINKIDKEEANIEKVKLDLARHGVEVEDFGGDTQVVCVSGRTGQGMEDLEESIITLSEILDIRAETAGSVEGWVIEAATKKEGRVATVLVRRGTLRGGDVIVAGSTWARVRRLRNEAGVEVLEAGPGTPVEVDGWKEQPIAGDEVLQAPDEGKAKSVVEFRLERAERFKLAEDMEAINESRRVEQERRVDSANETGEGKARIERQEGGAKFKEVFFIVKGDVSGSVEAVLNSVLTLGNDEVRPHVLRSGVGPVGEFDVEHAAAAKGHVISFNTTVDPHISRQAESLGVTIIDHQIIYRLIEDVKAKLSEQLSPSVKQRVNGEAEVSQIFDINIKRRVTKPIAGCKVRNGLISRNAKVRVFRDKEIIYSGTLASLKNAKKDVNEMHKGGECGMCFEDWNDFRVGDQVQCYEEIIERRFL
ncbi:hypothetical protein GP486_003442 [Trichoglossum hirsutum]|uniref:Translation initiation factor IF-2, mitochondrial n=1 Tax=Trichoglossum hirsutum TaxID=265104 RepID=A0A9P8RR53_9PEZI|nr:hypothetical protein GP486_003442 [Trichoglossum hirsutum]